MSAGSADDLSKSDIRLKMDIAHKILTNTTGDYIATTQAVAMSLSEAMELDKQVSEFLTVFCSARKGDKAYTAGMEIITKTMYLFLVLDKLKGLEADISLPKLGKVYYNYKTLNKEFYTRITNDINNFLVTYGGKNGTDSTV